MGVMFHRKKHQVPQTSEDRCGKNDGQYSCFVGGLHPGQALEAQRKTVVITNINKYALTQDVPSNEALDVLALQRRCDHNAFDDDIVG